MAPRPLLDERLPLFIVGRKLWCFFAPAGAGCLPPGLLDEHSAPAADGWFREWEHPSAARRSSPSTAPWPGASKRRATAC